MTHRIAYRHRMEYDTKVAGVVLPVVILAGDRAEAVSAAVDTGSTLCVFQQEVGERLGIKIEDGIEDYVSAMGTIVKVFGHEVTLVLDELSMDLIVYFPAYQQMPRNLLGRQGFLQRMLFGLDDYEGVVYFGYHEDQ